MTTPPPSGPRRHLRTVANPEQAQPQTPPKQFCVVNRILRLCLCRTPEKKAFAQIQRVQLSVPLILFHFLGHQMLTRWVGGSGPPVT